MTSGKDLIDANWKAAECQFYEGGSAIAQDVAIASLITGQYWVTVSAAAAGLAFEFTAGLAGCNLNPDEPSPGTDGVEGCRESSTPATLQVYQPATDSWVTSYGTLNPGYKDNVTKIVKVEKGTGGGPSYSRATVVVNGNDAVTYTANFDHGTQDTSQMNWRLVGGDCIDDVTPLPPDAIGVPTTVTDGDCNWTFTPKDSYIDASGAVRIYYVIEADNDACGGPFAYWSGPNGPTPVNPNPPDPSPDPIPPEPLPCCDDIKTKLDEIKDCACSSNEQPLEGDYRTITFISDENSPEGRRRLSKRFRYRSSSGVGLSGVVDHWRSFTWQAGAVIVTHTGSALGAPKVWAATAEEGKRVIRHAAGEAGIDADQVGRWIISGSSDPRFGMPGTMRVNTKGGYYWITSRLGPDQRPLVEEFLPDS